MKIASEKCICDRCNNEVSTLTTITTDHKDIKLCNKCYSAFIIWVNEYKRSNNAISMIYKGFNGHECCSYYSCPICNNIYNDYDNYDELMGKIIFRCTCGQLLKRPN